MARDDGASVLHASLAALHAGAGAWRGALLRGPSGVGKSDLLLRLVEAGWRLVADDRVTAWASGGALWGRSPDPLRGLLELRGQGMARLPALPLCRVACVVELRPPQERQPAPAWTRIADLALPLHHLAAAEAGAAARLRRLVAPALGEPGFLLD